MDMEGTATVIMATALTVTKTEKRGEHMIDLHTHLLPGLDDGARLEEASEWHRLRRVWNQCCRSHLSRESSRKRDVRSGKRIPKTS